MTTTRSQHFSAQVFPHVQEAARGPLASKYRGLSRSAGSLVRNSGLLPALAFLQARGTKAKERHHHHLLGYLQEEIWTLGLAPRQAHPESFPLVAWLQTCALADYLRLTREVLRLLSWHKRFAETLILKEDTNPGDNAS